MHKLERDPRVLFVTPFGFSRRGTLTYRTLPMVRALDKRGVRVRVLVADWDEEPASRIRYTDFGKKATIYSIPLKQEFPGTLGRFYAWMQMFRSMWKLARTWHPDIVHLVKPIGHPFLFLAWHYLCTKFTGKCAISAPIVLDCDDLESAWPQRGFAGMIWQLMGAQAETWAWKKADAVIAASHYLVDKIKRARVDSRIYLLPNTAFEVPILARPLASRRLLIPTRLLDIRPTILARWLEAIVQAVPEANVLLVGPSREASQVLREHASENLRRRMAVLGWQRAETYFRLLQRTRIGLYAVEDTPAARAKSPARLLSMMAAGVPIVAVDVGESRHLLGNAGIVAPPTQEDLATRIRELWDDQERLLKLGKKARNRAYQTFNEEKLAQVLAQAYNTVLQERSYES